MLQGFPLMLIGPFNSGCLVDDNIYKVVDVTGLVNSSAVDMT